MTNKEKFLALVSKAESSTLEKNSLRIKNREWLRESQDIALKVLHKLDELGWSQVVLAEKMGVSPQQVNKIVKGKENLTLQTQKTLQAILDIPILASYLEQKEEKIIVKNIFPIRTISSRFETSEFVNFEYSRETNNKSQTVPYIENYSMQNVC